MRGILLVLGLMASQLSAIGVDTDCSKNLDLCVQGFAVLESKDGKHPNLYKGEFKGIFQISETVFKEEGTRGAWVLGSRIKEYAFMKKRLKSLIRRTKNKSFYKLYMSHQQGIQGAIYFRRALAGKTVTYSQRVGVIKRMKTNVSKGIKIYTSTKRFQTSIKNFDRFWRNKIKKELRSL